MTRISKLAFVTFLIGLLSLVPVSAVTAHSRCTGYAQEHCEQLAAAQDAARSQVTEASSAVHVLSTSGIGQEHFEAMTVVQPELFVIAPSGPAVASVPTDEP